MGSPTAFLRELNAHVVNGSSFEVLRDCWNCKSSERQARISKLAIHALPYRALRGSPDFTGLRPIPGYINVLLTHSRVAGMKQLNTLHHTAYTIPSDVLLRGWDYIALGDWHIHRYQPLMNVPAFYAGSLEALNFGEAVSYPLCPNDTYAVYGALDVRLHLGKPADVRSLANSDARPVLRLEPVEAINENAKTLMDILYVRLHSGLPAHAIVLLEVNNILPQVWGQLDHASIAKLRKLVRRCEIRWNFQRTTPSQSGEAMSGAALDRQWEHFLEQREKNSVERAWYDDEGGIIYLGNLVCDDLSLDTGARGLVRRFQTARVIHTKLQYLQQLLNIIEKVITERQRGYQETEKEVSDALAQISTLKEQWQGHQVIIEQANRDYGKLEEHQIKHNAFQEKIANIDGKIEQSRQDIEKYQDAI